MALNSYLYGSSLLDECLIRVYNDNDYWKIRMDDTIF